MSGEEFLFYFCQQYEISTRCRIAKYHRTCLIKFDNNYQKNNNDKKEQANEHLMEGIAFSKVLEFIEESILAFDETTTPVFYLKELTEMYKKHLIA